MPPRERQHHVHIKFYIVINYIVCIYKTIFANLFLPFPPRVTM